MQITRLVKRLGRKINIGNFSTITLEVELESQINEKDDVSAVEHALYLRAEEILANDYKRVMASRTKTNE